MTIRAMVSLFAVGLTTLSLTACGNPDLSEEQADEIEAARDEAAQVTERLDELIDTVADLERELERATTASEERADKFGRRLDGISKRLNDRIVDLRAAVKEAAASSASAASNASAAVGEVRSVAQDLNVLRTRYDVHLRRFHGGG